MNIIQTGIREREIIFAKIGNIPTFYKIGNGKSERWGKITEGQKNYIKILSCRQTAFLSKIM